MFSYLEMMRPKNCLMAAFAVLIGSFLYLKLDLLLVWTPVAFAILAALLITGAGNVINDYFDVSADKVNRPKRPIPSGKVSRRMALAFSIILFVLGISMATLTTNIAFSIAVINSVLLIAYSWSLQHRAFLGNLSVAYLTGSTFIFGGAAVGNVQLAMIFGLLAGLTTLSREIVKDMEDVEGDRKMFQHKNPLAKRRLLGRFNVTKEGVELSYSEGTSLAIADIALIAAVLLSPLPYILGLAYLSYLPRVIPADVIFLACITMSRKAKKPEQFGRLSRLIKYGYFLGLLAFVGGILIMI